MNTCLEYIPTRRERIGWRLFPSQHCDIPDIGNMRDCVITKTTVDLSLMDRLRVLISGRIEVTAKTATGNEVGAYATNAVFNVRPPRWLSR